MIAEIVVLPPGRRGWHSLVAKAVVLTAGNPMSPKAPAHLIFEHGDVVRLHAALAAYLADPDAAEVVTGNLAT